MGEQMLMDLINSLQVVEQGKIRKRGTGFRPPIEFSKKLFLISEKREVYFELKRTALFNPVVGQLNDRPIIHRESFTEALTIEIFPAFWKLLMTDLEKISFFEAKKLLINYFSQSLPQHITHVCVNVSKNEAVILRDIENPVELFHLNHQDIQNLFLANNYEDFCYRILESNSKNNVIHIQIGLPNPENTYSFGMINPKIGVLSQNGMVIDIKRPYISLNPNFSELFIRQDDSFDFTSFIGNCETNTLSPFGLLRTESLHYSVAILASAPLFNHLPNCQYPINIQ
jgi:hypothetical protein